MGDRTVRAIAVSIMLLGGAGCSNTLSPGSDHPEVPRPPRPVTIATAEHDFADGLALLTQGDRKGRWTDQACREAAAVFGSVAAKLDRVGDDRARVARYNQAVAYGRCQWTAQARPILQQLLDDQPNFHRARVQLAIHRLADAGEGGLVEAITQVERAVRDAQYQNVEALVFLAMLQMRRGSEERDGRGHHDLDRAELNLQRALAIDDRFMPALNQLAVYYLQRAKRKAGRSAAHLDTAVAEKSKVDTAMLELASLVCSQAIRKDPSYAPIHNTAGLINAELGDLSAAAQAFALARRLDPRFFEAHMNYGAINLQFRGFENAEHAYQAALDLESKDYDARLGLALALRGQIRHGGTDPLLEASTKQLHAAKRLDGTRPEAYFNEAILVKEFRATGGPKAKPMLLQARGLFRAFVDRAEGKAHLVEAVASARERVADINRILEFLEQSPSRTGQQ
jgi:tetratricopeptide (TPR) repeat protein